MTLKDQLRSVGAALRRGSPIVVDVPPAIRHLLLQRHMAMSMQNGRLSLAAFALMLFGFAHEAPLLPRIAAWGLLALIYAVRKGRVRRMLAALDPGDPKPDRLYDTLLVLASSVWGAAPFVLQPWLSEPALFCVIYAAFISISLLAITYIAALPAGVLLVMTSALPLVTFLALQASFVLGVLAFGTLVCTMALLMRLASSHDTLLQALASERENAALVQELESCRRALESENASLDSSLRAAAHAANRDPLTGLYNRRHIASFAAPLEMLVRGGNEKVTLCMIDVDHFKQVNDRHGHGVGDEVLRAVGVLLGARLRDGDCLARIGGEEFLAVLRQCDLSRARRVAESVRHNVAASVIRTAAGEVPITVSLGVAEWSADERFEQALKRADRALYEAKHGGRDRVQLDDTERTLPVMRAGDSPPPGVLH